MLSHLRIIDAVSCVSCDITAPLLLVASIVFHLLRTAIKYAAAAATCAGMLQLSDAASADVAERLEEFVSYCAPPTGEGDFTVSRHIITQLLHWLIHRHK